MGYRTFQNDSIACPIAVQYNLKQWLLLNTTKYMHNQNLDFLGSLGYPRKKILILTMCYTLYLSSGCCTIRIFGFGGLLGSPNMDHN